MYRRRKGGKGKGGVKTALKKLQKKVSKMAVAREVKEFYTAVTTMTSSATTGSGFQIQNLLSDVVQGDDYLNRTGRKITPVGCNLKIMFRGSLGVASATLQPRLVRFILFQDMGYNGIGSNLSASQLLQASSTATDNISTAISPINTDYIRTRDQPDQRAHILVDKSFWIHPTLSAYANECTHKFDIKVPSKKLKEIYFNGTGSNTVVAGAIFLYVCLGQASAPTDNAEFAYINKLTYVDE